MRERVEMARGSSARCFHGNFASVACNAHGQVVGSMPTDPSIRRRGELLARAASELGLAARGYHRVLKVARTIADLDGDAGITRQHVVEALHYRTDSPEA